MNICILFSSAAWAAILRTSCVLPEEGGPAISVTIPNGTPNQGGNFVVEWSNDDADSSLLIGILYGYGILHPLSNVE